MREAARVGSRVAERDAGQKSRRGARQNGGPVAATPHRSGWTKRPLAGQPLVEWSEGTVDAALHTAPADASREATNQLSRSSVGRRQSATSSLTFVCLQRKYRLFRAISWAFDMLKLKYNEPMAIP